MRSATSAGWPGRPTGTPGYLPGDLLGCVAVLPAADGHVRARLGQAQSRGRADPAGNRATRPE
jgi:hypothetical protein